MCRILASTLLVLCLLASTAAGHAQDFQKGLDAFNKQDYASALREWRPLAEKGNASAQFNLGAMYDLGRGVPKDAKEASKWYRLSAEQGNADAANNMGMNYRLGLGVPRDDKESVRWYRLSAEQGNASGQANLGLAYDIGAGVIQSNVYAHMWLNVSASNGHKVAASSRYTLEKEMTLADISKAQELARQCVAKSYKNCD